jgi:hypothetical protein
MRKTIWTLNVENYSPEITGLTYPLLRHYAHKIGADFRIISERKFPEWPVVYEKLQLHELGRDFDWNIYIDSDALVHPNMFDPTNHMSKDTVAHNGNDMAGNRWRYDHLFRRDGRHIGSCNWFTVASDWCLDLWKPLDDLSLPQALSNIFPTPEESAPFMFALDQNGKRIERNGGFVKIDKTVITPEHLIDDYTLSRNIAKHGLKFTTIMDISRKLNDGGVYLWHAYTVPAAEKIRQMKEALLNWGLDNFELRGA